MTINRRMFLKGSTALAAALPVMKSYAGGHMPFQHGVASGDPLSDRVILWSRITPDVDPLFADANVPYRWEIALDPAISSIVNQGSGITGPDVDFTVKVDAGQLLPGTTYYYRFYSNGVASPTGRTRTLPVNHVERLRIAFCSCSNYPMGFFNVYREIAARADLDAVLHLGDYIYEYGPGGFGTDTGLGRDPVPAKDIVALQDYRQRYAQYRGDPDLQEAHRQHPFICIWDDHETADNAWYGGAANHDPATQGDWFARRSAANRAYFEWMPIRDNGLIDQFGDHTIYRQFRFGDLVDLFMLDTRILARDKQADWGDQATADDINRSLLGFEQEQWLNNGLSRSQSQGVRWRVLGQQVMMAQLSLADDVSINMDQWDGYTATRDRLFNYVADRNIDNFMVLTGDIHSSWAFDLTPNPFNLLSYGRLSGRGALGGEFVTPGVTSTFLEKSPLTTVASIALGGGLPHLKWTDITQRGYVLLDIDHRRTKAHWYHVDTVESRQYNAYLAKIFRQNAGENHIRPAFVEAPVVADAAPLAPAYGVELTQWLRNWWNRFSA